jgi:hypothetical protein
MMKPTKLLFVLAFMLLVPAVASAQGYRRGGGGGYYAGQPPTYQLPGGFWNRQGRLTFGGSIGLGAMSDRFGDIECNDCDYNPVSGMLAGHIGGFIGPRLALLGEVQVNGQTVSSDRFSGDTTTLIQSTLMIAAQFWVTPQLWIKGGIGFANLRLERSYYGDGIVDESSIPENGMALMGAVGYELLSARYFSIDLQGRLINGAYKGIDNTVTGASIGVGINWY